MNSIVLILPLLAVYTTVTRSANTSNPAWTEKYAEGCELRVRVIVANSLVSRPSRSGLTAPVALIRAVVAGDCHPSYARLFDIHGCAAISLRRNDGVAVGEDLELAVYQPLAISAGLGRAASAAQSAASRCAAFVEAAIRVMSRRSRTQGSDGRCRAKET